MTTGYEPPESDLVPEAAYANTPLFSPRGRIGRVRLLAHSMWITSVIMLAAMLLMAFVGGELSDATFTLAAFLSTAVTAVLYVKRSHDMNMSGLLAVLMLVPLVNLFFIFVPGTKGNNTYGPPPPANTPLLWAGALVYPLIFLVGILAAIMVPAYQDYTARAQIGEGFVLASEPKAALAEYLASRGELPGYTGLSSLGLDEPRVSQYASLTVEPDTGLITVTMCEEPDCVAAIAGKSFTFTPAFTGNDLSFVCSSEQIESRFLPQACK